MKKTLSISIASTLFWLEDDAYQELDRYLSAIRAHFAKTPECDEIVADIEARIAEQFLESKKKIITITEVTTVIHSMGQVDDFGGGADSAKSSSEKGPEKQGETVRRLYRNPNDKVVAGVCSGIAAYLGTDVVWVRITFGLLTFLNGLGFLLYILFYFSMPVAKTGAQQLQMEGAPITLETISERVKERVEEVRQDEGLLRRIVNIPIMIASTVFTFIGKSLLPMIGKIAGGIIAFFAGVFLLVISIGLGYALMNLSSGFIDYPIHAIVPTGALVAGLFAAYFALMVPLLFVSFLGTSLIVGKSTLRTSAAMSLLGLWFVALLIGGVLAASFGTRVAAFMSTDPSYQDATRPVAIAPFSSIVARNGVNVVFTQSASTTVTLSGRAKDLDHVSVKSEGGVLTLETVRDPHFCIFCDFSLPQIRVSGPALTNFDGENGVRISSSHIVSTSTLTVTLSNGAHGSFDIDTRELNASISNAAWLELTGTTSAASLKGENGAEFDAAELSAGRAVINVSNGSRADIGKTNTLEVKAQNGGFVSYAGDPVVTKDVRNGSTIERADANDQTDY